MSRRMKRKSVLDDRIFSSSDSMRAAASVSGSGNREARELSTISSREGGPIVVFAICTSQDSDTINLQRYLGHDNIRG